MKQDKCYRIVSILFLVMLSTSCQKSVELPIEKTGTLKISFRNTVKGIPIVLGTGNYTNGFGEQYVLTKFKYYISNVSVSNIDAVSSETNSYHLIDEAKPASLSFSFPVKIDSYVSLKLLLGVDSLRNVSGAQTGALDPLNDMFWTWNSGYIMAKLEGNSPQSTVVNNKVEYHIGGFSGSNNALKNLTLTFPVGKILDIREGKTSEIFIDADIDTWWQNPNDLRISTDPVIATPSAMAKKIADNYSKMLQVKDVINY